MKNQRRFAPTKTGRLAPEWVAAFLRNQWPESAEYADQRILSVYDHQTICLPCKKAEELRPDYSEVSRDTIGECMASTELQYGDPQGFCFHHFYPYTCGSK